MATFAYRAMEKGGKEIGGRIDASAESVVVDRLRDMGYFPTEVRRIKTESAGDVSLEEIPGIKQLYQLLTRGRVKQSTLTLFTRELAAQAHAGWAEDPELGREHLAELDAWLAELDGMPPQGER